MQTALNQRAVRAGPDLADVYGRLLGSARPLLWPAHLAPLLAPLFVPGLGASAWAIGLLLWAAVGLMASAGRMGAPPAEIPPAPWAAWRFGLAALGLLAAASIGGWAVAGAALYGIAQFSAARAGAADAL